MQFSKLTMNSPSCADNSFGVFIVASNPSSKRKTPCEYSAWAVAVFCLGNYIIVVGKQANRAGQDLRFWIQDLST